MWVISSLPLGVLLTLSVWLGMGKTRLLWRVAIALAAVLYVGSFTLFGIFSQATESSTLTEMIMIFLQAAGELAMLLFLLGGTFFLVSRRFEITRFDADTLPTSGDRMQFSIFQILIVMSVVAIVLCLLRLVRAAIGHEPSTWESITLYAFMFVNFFLTTACAAFAALGTGKILRNVVLVSIVTVLLGATMAVAIGNKDMGWWLSAGMALVVIVPMAVVLVSLLVVRSCGYRLVRRRGWREPSET